MLFMLQEKLWLNITHFPWPDDPACRRYSVQFGSGLGVVGLASYPSSGNTWLRYLIEAITGIYTGSMYNDVTIRCRAELSSSSDTIEEVLFIKLNNVQEEGLLRRGCAG